MASLVDMKFIKITFQSFLISLIPIVVHFVLSWTNEESGFKSLIEMIFTLIHWICLLPASLVLGGVSQGFEGVKEQSIAIFILVFILHFIRIKFIKKKPC